jgi:hypothetical protein
MGRIIPILLTILLAGGAGFALGRSMSGMDQRIAASSAAKAAGCAVTVGEVWTTGDDGDYAASAHTSGQDCAGAVATIVVRNPGGGVLWTEAYPTAQVFGLSDAGDPEAMRAALAAWLPKGDAMLNNTAKLPDWAAGQPGPSGEFPFMPEPDIDQTAYAAWKAKAVPLFCYPQGKESMACAALDAGRMDKLGVQLFPG